LVEFRLKLPRGGENNVWMRKQLVDAFGRDIRILAGSMTAILYSPNADTSEIISNTQLLIKELELKVAREAKQTRNS